VPLPTWFRSDRRFRFSSPRAVFWLSFGFLFLISALWSVSSPAMSSPDEPAHATKAAAVVRGQLLGDQTGLPAGRGAVEVPQLFRTGEALTQCYLGNFASPHPDEPQPAVDAACYRAFRGDPEAPDSVVTSAVRYNPLYYALAGLPSLLPLSTATFHLMRLVSALLAAWLFALTLRTLQEPGRTFWPTAAFTVAVTPMTVFLCGSINPQSAELPASALVWSALIALVRFPDPALRTRRLLRLFVGVLFLANVRGLGPALLLIIVTMVVLVSPWRQTWAVLRDRRTWPCLAASAVAVGAGTWWTVATGTVSTVSAVRFPEFTGAAIVKRTLATTDYYVRQSLGIFGWLDTFQPGWAYLLEAGLILAVVLVGFAVASTRERLALLATAAAVVLLPVYAQYSQSPHIGLFWQGRYGLPVAIGVPLLAGSIVRASSRQLPDWWSRRMTATIFAGAAAVHTVALVVNVRRYVLGVDAQTPWLTWPPDVWLPPVPPWLLIVGSLLAWSGLAVAALRGASRAPDGTVGAGDSAGDSAEDPAGAAVPAAPQAAVSSG
jgi:hypothetical protein